MASVFPQDIMGPSILRAALPEPKRARKEAFLLRVDVFSIFSACFSIDTIAKAKALILEAEEAIPLLCGNELDEVMSK